MGRQRRMGTALLFLLLCVHLLRPIAAQVVQCTVGGSGTYANINAALTGCNGGVGSIELLLDGQFTEVMNVPVGVTNLTLTSVEFAAGLVPAAPLPSNVTTRITGSNHFVTNVSTALYIRGVIMDGASAGAPMFQPWLINNNVTLDRCLVANWTGDFCIKVLPCERAVSINIVNTRFFRVWGTTVWAEGMEDITVLGNTLDRVGGYHNQSGMYLKPSYVTEGIWHVSNNSGWLITDAQPESCIFLGDTNGMTRCNRGVQECYNVLETEARRPNCVKENVSYVPEGTNTTLYTLDYPLSCRIYTPCVCQDLVFFDANTSATVVLPIGDIYFYTGLRLNCTAVSGDSPFIVLTGTTNVTDPNTNVTTPKNNDELFVFQGSNAGDGGIGQRPPLSDPTGGFSLYPNVYVEGVIDPAALNCSCPPSFNSSMAALGFDCDYMVIENDTFCMNGLVRSCELDFLTCYPASDALVTVLSIQGYIGNDTASLEAFCLANGTLSLQNETASQTPCNPVVTFNATAEWTLWLVGGYACVGTFPADTAFEVVTPGLTSASALALCSTDPDLIAQGCPTIPSITGAAEINVTCDVNCSTSDVVESEIVLVRVCARYTCPQTWNTTCVYTYVTNTSVITHTINTTYVLTDGRTWDNVSNAWSTGEPLCAATDPDEAAQQAIQCAQQTSKGHPCAPANSTLASFNATLLSGGFPSEGTAVCGAPYQCAAPNVTTCSCDIADTGPCLAEYEVGTAAAMYHFDNINDGLAFVDSSFNRASQLYYGAIIDRTSRAVIMNNSIFATYYSHYRSVASEWHRQNYQTDGAFHEVAVGLFSDQPNIRPYQYFCDDDCPPEYIDEAEFDCTVDASITVDAQDNTYQLIQDAIDDGCENILLRNYENYYTENIDFGNDFKRLYSPDGACILGNQHKLSKDSIDFRGVCFIHPGDEAKPLFVPDGDMDRLWIRNCILEGQGVKGGGVLPFNWKKKIKDLVINDTEVSTWNYAIVLLKNVDTFTFSNNWVHDSYGRLIEARVENVYRVHDNVFVACRGAGFTKGAPLVRMIAKSLGKYGQQQNDQDRTCSDDRERDYGQSCAFYNNVQNTDVTEEDFSDVCFSLLGGAITLDDIFDNVCVKASIGFQLRQLDVIVAATVSTLLIRNSMIRPSNFRTTARASSVRDWVYDQFYTKLDKPFIFVPFQKQKCNFPCDLPDAQFPVCIVNPNFLPGYVGVPGETYSVYGQQVVSAFGFGVYTNASHALAFCDIVRINPFTGAVERPIFFTGDKGGVMFRDVFSVNKTGVTFYGALLPGEPNICPECFPRSRIYGSGWQILAENFTSANMSYEQDDRAMDQVTHMFTTLPNLQPVWHVNFTNNTFDGGNLTPYSAIYVLRLVMDIDEDTEYSNNRRRGGRKLPSLNKQPNAEVVIEWNVFENFAGYNPDGLVDQDTKEGYNTTLDEYPFTDPIYIEFQNRNKNKSFAWIRFNVFRNIDDRSIDIREASFANISNNLFVDVGSRSDGNPTGVLITGSTLNPSFVYFINNNISQTRPILSDRTLSRINPGWYSHVWFTGFLNGSVLCVQNNTINGSAVAIRWSGMDKSVVTSCINSTLVPGFFNDDVDFLRRLWYVNQDADGYVHDLVYGHPYQDFFQTWLFCDDGCPGTLDACNVSLTDPFYTPIHPFWNTQVFTDLALAITNCTHPSRRIRVKYNSPSAPYVLPGPVSFPAGHPALNASYPITTIFGEEHNATTPKVELRLCGLQVLNGIFQIEDFRIVHNCGAGSPTIDLNVPDPSPLPLELRILTNDFVGGSVATSAINGTADEGLTIGEFAPGSGKQVFYKALQTGAVPAASRGNTFSGYLGERVVNLYGRSCAVDITVRFNQWSGCPGNCFYVDQVGGIEFDYNTVSNALASPTTLETAAVYISVCQPVSSTSHHLYVRDNVLSNGTVGYNPTVFRGPTIGYITGIWVDPTPTPYLDVQIKRNKGYFPGACLREDNKPVQYPITDRQLPARKISQRDYNIHCQGGWHDIRLNQAPSFDATIDTNPSYYKAYFCDDGCPHTTDLQLAVLVGLGAGLIGAFIVVLVVWMVFNAQRARNMWSGVAGEIVPTNTGRLYTEGTISRMAIRTQQEVADEWRSGAVGPAL